MPDTPHPDPFHELEVTLARLEANQRTPRTVEVTNRCMRLLGALLIVCALLAVMNVASLITRTAHADSAPKGASTTGTPVSDPQFAAQFNGITVHYPDTRPITVAQVPAVVAYACKPGNLDPVILPPAAWHQIQALLAETDRCSR